MNYSSTLSNVSSYKFYGSFLYDMSYLVFSANSCIIFSHLADDGGSSAQILIYSQEHTQTGEADPSMVKLNHGMIHI